MTEHCTETVAKLQKAWGNLHISSFFFWGGDWEWEVIPCHHAFHVYRFSLWHIQLPPHLKALCQATLLK